MECKVQSYSTCHLRFLQKCRSWEHQELPKKKLLGRAITFALGSTGPGRLHPCWGVEAWGYCTTVFAFRLLLHVELDLTSNRQVVWGTEPNWAELVQDEHTCWSVQHLQPRTLHFIEVSSTGALFNLKMKHETNAHVKIWIPEDVLPKRKFSANPGLSWYSKLHWHHSFQWLHAAWGLLYMEICFVASSSTWWLGQNGPLLQC